MTRPSWTRWSTGMCALLMLVAIVGAAACGGWASHRLSRDAGEHSATALIQVIALIGSDIAARVAP